MSALNHSDHIFRHIKKTWVDGEFINPIAFRLRSDEDGLSVNWVEYFQKLMPQEAIPSLVKILEKRRKVGGESKFALLNVGDAIKAAKELVSVSIVLDEVENDPSHALIKGYQSYNDEVAEALSRVVFQIFPAKGTG